MFVAVLNTFQDIYYHNYIISSLITHMRGYRYSGREWWYPDDWHRRKPHSNKIVWGGNLVAFY